MLNTLLYEAVKALKIALEDDGELVTYNTFFAFEDFAKVLNGAYAFEALQGRTYPYEGSVNRVYRDGNIHTLITISIDCGTGKGMRAFEEKLYDLSLELNDIAQWGVETHCVCDRNWEETHIKYECFTLVLTFINPESLLIS